MRNSSVSLVSQQQRDKPYIFVRMKCKQTEEVRWLARPAENTRIVTNVCRQKVSEGQTNTRIHARSNYGDVSIRSVGE